MAVLLAVVCLAAAAEGTQDGGFECAVENGLLVIRVPLAPDDPGEWIAAMHDEGEDRAMIPQPEDETDGFAVFTFAPAANGWDMVDILHYVGLAADEFYSIAAEVENGAFSEVPYVNHIVSPEEAKLEPYMVGEWLEAETQFRTLEISDLEGRGWNLTVTSPMTHGAYRFTATVQYDCSEDGLIYTDGMLYNLPTEGEDFGEPVEKDMIGWLFLDVTSEDDGHLLLDWADPVTEEPVHFRRNWEGAPDVLVPEILDYETGEDTVPDGVYWADIEPEDLKTGKRMDVIIYTADVYSGADIAQVTPGEMIFRDYKIYWVNSVGDDSTVEYTEAATGNSGTLRFVNIPGTEEYAAVDVSGSGFPMIASQGIFDMDLGDGAKMLLIGSGLTAETVDTEAMAKAIEEDDAFIDCQTVVRVQDNKITEIRHYRDVEIPDMMADARSLK